MTAIDRRVGVQTAAWATLALMPKCALCWFAWSAAGLELCGATPAAASWFSGWLPPLVLGATATLLTHRCHNAAYHGGTLCSR